MFDFLTKIFRAIVPSWNDRQLAEMQTIVEEINSLEKHYEAMSDDELKAQTELFRKRMKEDEATLDDLLPEAFAVVREAAKRILGERHYDVQLIGGIALHRGIIAEMKTGEGKTLAATLPMYLNALTGRGCHLITVNDYLAKRDAEWMGQIYTALGLTVGYIIHGLTAEERREAYGCDITYGTNNEFGFDYLRDNMAIHQDELVLSDLHYAIVDEVDSILVDEARTPLIISGPAERAADLYLKYASIAKKLKKGEDYTVDEKAHSVVITEDGIARVEEITNLGNLYDPQNMGQVHYLAAALKAKELYHRDKQYIIERGEVIIVDEFTGRLMHGRRYSDGIHQAVEAKEGVKIRSENQTLATITFQNFFRMYDKLAGMTGTAVTEAREFADIYNLDVIVVPTNRPIIRDDKSDVVYRTREEKFEAIVEDIKVLHAKKQPVLVGTIAIETSEMLAKMLKKAGVPCQVLNAKHHAKEAEIVANAGIHGAVTIATNMAGRGTDIKLDDEAKKAGGLYILGTERHDSRRIDNQLRGRSGRQGDPGASQFFLSMEDDLMRLFGGPNIMGLMDRLGWERGEPLEHGMLSRAIEKAQKRVETHHFEIRKQVLKYDDVMNEQRTIIYEQRRKALTKDDVRDELDQMFDDVVDGYIDTYINPELGADSWDFESLTDMANATFNLDVHKQNLERLDRDELKTYLISRAKEQYKEKERAVDEAELRAFEKYILLQLVDEYWKEHLGIMDHLQEGIGLRGYAGRDPLVEYKIEALDLFNIMIHNIKETALRYLCHLQVEGHHDASIMPEQQRRDDQNLTYGAPAGGGESKQAPKKSTKVGRNSPCPCGSGKKYKKCCGRK